MRVRALLEVFQGVQQLVPGRTTPALETCSVLGWQSCVGVHVSALSLYLPLAGMPGESSRTCIPAARNMHTCAWTCSGRSKCTCLTQACHEDIFPYSLFKSLFKYGPNFKVSFFLSQDFISDRCIWFLGK